MTISFTQAEAALAAGGYSTVESILDLVKTVSGKVAGATSESVYLLFSGMMTDGTTYASEVAKSIKQAGGGVDVVMSEVGQLVKTGESGNGPLRAALRNAIKLEILGDASVNPTPAQIIAMENRFQEVMFGKDINGVRTPNANSLWDIASAKYVAEAEGNFRIIAPKTLDELSVFVQSELPALLKNAKVGTIDGLPLADLQALEKTHGLDAVKKLITYNSLTQVVYTGLSTSNIDDYLKATPEKLNALASDQTKLKAIQDYLGTLRPEERASLKAADDIIHNVSKASSGFGSLFRKALGPAAILLGLGLAAYEAGAAESRGDHDSAKEIMTRWAVEAAGSEIAMIAATGIAGIGAAALVAAGVIAAPVAGGIVVGVMLLGGFFGGDGALELYDLTKGLDNNGKMDLFDKLGNLVFGADYTLTSPLPADLNGERLTLDTTFSRDKIVSNAKDNIAWRYALRELNPFVIPDISYDHHNTDGSLDLYDEATGQGTMTELYLQDRAAMLTWKIRYDKGMEDDNDVPREGMKPYTEQWDTSEVQGNWDFVDMSLKLDGGPLTLAIDGQGVSAYAHGNGAQISRRQSEMLRSTGKITQKRNASNFHIAPLNQAANTPWLIAA